MKWQQSKATRFKQLCNTNMNKWQSNQFRVNSHPLYFSWFNWNSDVFKLQNDRHARINSFRHFFDYFTNFYKHKIHQNHTFNKAHWMAMNTLDRFFIKIVQRLLPSQIKCQIFEPVKRNQRRFRLFFSPSLDGKNFIRC